MEGKLLYPQFQSNKTVGRQTAANYTNIVHGEEVAQVDTQVSSGDRERLYADCGTKVTGPCELRQAWKYNDITPRTYFSQGGTTFHASKYIRIPINELTNMFPEVNYPVFRSMIFLLTTHRMRSSMITNPSPRYWRN